MLHKNESDDNQDNIETLQTSLQEEIQKRQTAEEDMKRYIQVIYTMLSFSPVSQV